jgi:hypothetical protein
LPISGDGFLRHEGNGRGVDQLLEGVTRQLGGGSVGFHDGALLVHPNKQEGIGGALKKGKVFLVG